MDQLLTVGWQMAPLLGLSLLDKVSIKTLKWYHKYITHCLFILTIYWGFAMLCRNQIPITGHDSWVLD